MEFDFRVLNSRTNSGFIQNLELLCGSCSCGLQKVRLIKTWRHKRSCYRAGVSITVVKKLQVWQWSGNDGVSG